MLKHDYKDFLIIEEHEDDFNVFDKNGWFVGNAFTIKEAKEIIDDATDNS